MTDWRQADGEALEPQQERPSVHPSKYPGSDRAPLVSAGKVPPMSLKEAVRSFDRAGLSATVEAANRERAEVTRRFPLEAWPTMPIERYALGTNVSAESFCRWMEFNTPNLASIKGGSALKHLIFKRKGPGDDWYFEKKYRSLDEAWDSVRAGFVEAFRLAGEGRFDEIGNLDAISNAYSLSTKATYCYFPNDLLPVCSSAHEPRRSGSSATARARPTALGTRRADAQRDHVAAVRLG
jgi:hypothetical protein